MDFKLNHKYLKDKSCKLKRWCCLKVKWGLLKIQQGLGMIKTNFNWTMSRKECN